MKLNSLIKKLFPSKQSRRVRPWTAIKGDKTLRLNYELHEHSLVFDLGGYEGQWTSDIFSKYLCNVYVFEPFLPYADYIRERFIQNSKIKVFPFGLGKEEKRLPFYVNNDASSTFRRSRVSHEIEIRRASTFFRDANIARIDLMKINIEGGEYDLLEEILEAGLVTRIQNIQVQFHDFVPNGYLKMKKIQEFLSITHQLTYQYEFVWENWKLKS